MRDYIGLPVALAWLHGEGVWELYEVGVLEVGEVFYCL